MRIPGAHVGPVHLRVDVVSGSYVGLDTSVRFVVHIEPNVWLAREQELLRAEQVRLSRSGPTCDSRLRLGLIHVNACTPGCTQQALAAPWWQLCIIG